MDYKQLNKLFKNFKNLERTYKKVASSQDKNYYEEKDQGETGEKVEVFDIQIDGMYLQVTTKSDSYGDNETVSSMQFVQPITKEVTDYIPVK